MHNNAQYLTNVYIFTQSLTLNILMVKLTIQDFRSIRRNLDIPTLIINWFVASTRIYNIDLDNHFIFRDI